MSDETRSHEHPVTTTIHLPEPVIVEPPVAAEDVDPRDPDAEQDASTDESGNQTGTDPHMDGDEATAVRTDDRPESPMAEALNSPSPDTETPPSDSAEAPQATVKLAPVESTDAHTDEITPTPFEETAHGQNDESTETHADDVIELTPAENIKSHSTEAVELPADETPAAPAEETPAPEFAEPAAPQVDQPPLARYDRPRFIAWMNQKGGVGKTTSTVNVGAALARSGRNVLLIDLDPQAHLTLHLGIDPGELDHTLYDLFTDDDISAFEIVRGAGDNLCILPAETNLAGVENELAADMMIGRAQRILTQKCEALLQSAGFDYVLIDCPPSLGLLTINALTLAREVIVPMQAHFLALQGMTKLLETVQIVSQGFNPGLVVSGIVLCMHEGQTLLAGEIQTELDDFLAASRDTHVPWQNAIVHAPPIRRNIKLAESPSFGQSIFDYDPECKGAKDYARLAESLTSQEATV